VVQKLWTILLACGKLRKTSPHSIRLHSSKVSSLMRISITTEKRKSRSVRLRLFAWLGIHSVESDQDLFSDLRLPAGKLQLLLQVLFLFGGGDRHTAAVPAPPDL